MPIHLQFAPSADLLLGHVFASLRNGWTDPFSPPTLLVPSPAVGKWLTLRLTEEMGCLMALEKQTLERYLWQMLKPAESQSRLGTTDLQQIICALLDESLLLRKEFQSLREYLGEPIDPLKRVQLSAMLARQFQEYEFNRPSVWDPALNKWRVEGMDACWLKGKSYFTANDISESLLAQEAWQSELYRIVHAASSQEIQGESGVQNWISLPHLHRLRRESGCADGSAWSVTAGPVFMFQVAKISHFHRNILLEIAQMSGVDLHVFLTNPCAEFWEDVDTWRGRKAHRRKWQSDSPDAAIPSRKPTDYGKSELSEITDLAEDPPLLELWGHTGKENIFLWCPQADWTFDYASPKWIEDEVPTSLLKALQYSLLRRESQLPTRVDQKTWVADTSLQVLASPDPTREVEELREQVLDLIQQGTIQNLDEVVVYLPKPAEYLPQIHRVFGAYWPSDPAYIPFSVLGAPGGDSLFAQGVAALLNIVAGQFDRVNVFTLLRNPLVQATRNFGPEDVAVWESWAHELGIFRGYDREQRRSMGDQGAYLSDAHTFDVGIARLLLGNLAAGPIDLGFKLLDDTQSSAIPIYRDYESSDSERLECFCAAIEDLHTQTSSLQKLIAENSLAQALDAWIEILWKWFGKMPIEKFWNSASESRVRKEYVDALLTLKNQAPLSIRNERIEVQEWVELMQSVLPQELPASSKAWIGGLTFAPLRPSMVLPHKVIFVLGLNASAFPGTRDQVPSDLVAHKRIVGDSDPVRDNRFAFLELLHAAGERLVLSFRARNLQKEEELQPSSVIQELESYLKTQGLWDAQEKQCSIRRVVPWILRESIADSQNAVRPQGTWFPTEAGLAQILSESVVHSKRRYPTPPMLAQNSGPLRTNLFSLRKFFANPLEYHLTRTLNLEIDDDAQTMSASDEPLLSNALDVSSLQKKILIQLLQKIFPAQGEQPLRDEALLNLFVNNLVTQIHNEFVLQGQSPEAQFALMERDQLQNWGSQIATTFLHSSCIDDFADHQFVQGTDLSLGRAGANAILQQCISATETCQVECIHAMALVPHEWKIQENHVALFALKSQGEAKQNADLWLEGVLQYLHGQSACEITFMQINRQDCSLSQAKFKSDPELWSKVNAWLSRMLAQMLVEGVTDHFPYAVVRDCVTGTKKLEELSWKDRWRMVTRTSLNEKLSDEDRGSYRVFFEEFSLVETELPCTEFLADRDQALQKLAQERFAPMLEGWVHE